MTGPAYGKIPVKAEVILSDGEETKLHDCNIYIHLKGYSLAKVTHIDMESQAFSRGRDCGVLVIGGTNSTIIIPKYRIKVKNKAFRSIIIKGFTFLNKGERIGGYLGYKAEGVFIGLRREGIKKLEAFAKELSPEFFPVDNNKDDS